MRDAKSLFKFRREFGHGGGDPGRLFDKGGHHSLGQLGLVPDEFGRGQNEGKLVVDVVAQNGKFLVEVQ